MAFRSILVSVDIDGPSVPLIKLAADLATRFSARLVGVCSADVPPPVVTIDGVVFDGDLISEQRRMIEARLDTLRAEFHTVAKSVADRDWRDAVGNPTQFLLDNARVADLIVAEAVEGPGPTNIYRSVDPGSLVLHAGRPVLVAESGAERLLAGRVLVAWKDSREARRALSDALPFLAAATEVVVASVDSEGDPVLADSLRDVVTFLGRHGVDARSELIKEADADEALVRLARSMKADLMVSGAYGHSRVREWIFGGVTRTLLGAAGISRLMAS